MGIQISAYGSLTLSNILFLDIMQAWDKGHDACMGRPGTHSFYLSSPLALHSTHAYLSPIVRNRRQAHTRLDLSSHVCA